MMDEMDRFVEACATAAQAAVHAYENSVMDLSYWQWSPEWSEASAGERAGMIACVKVALAGATDQQQHEAWCAMVRKAGWTYGRGDAAGKTPPGLVEWDRLPFDQAAKYHLYGTVVRAMAAAHGVLPGTPRWNIATITDATRGPEQV